MQISKSFDLERQITPLTTNISSQNFHIISLHTLNAPDWFIPTITTIVNSHIYAPKHPMLKFSLSEDAAIYNMKILQRHGDSIQDFIASSPGTFISPGSKFRPVHLLEPLFMHHHNWPKIKQILTQGSNWPLHPLTNAVETTNLL
jgi:hypothetical protein